MNKKISDYTDDKDCVDLQSDSGKELIKLILAGTIEVDSYFKACYGKKKGPIVDAQTLNLMKKVAVDLKSDLVHKIEKRMLESPEGLEIAARCFWKVVNGK